MLEQSISQASGLHVKITALRGQVDLNQPLVDRAAMSGKEPRRLQSFDRGASAIRVSIGAAGCVRPKSISR
jgi:hypothetical protein